MTIYEVYIEDLEGDITNSYWLYRDNAVIRQGELMRRYPNSKSRIRIREVKVEDSI